MQDQRMSGSLPQVVGASGSNTFAVLESLLGPGGAGQHMMPGLSSLSAGHPAQASSGLPTQSFAQRDQQPPSRPYDQDRSARLPASSCMQSDHSGSKAHGQALDQAPTGMESSAYWQLDHSAREERRPEQGLAGPAPQGLSAPSEGSAPRFWAPRDPMLDELHAHRNLGRHSPSLIPTGPRQAHTLVQEIPDHQGPPPPESGSQLELLPSTRTGSGHISFTKAMHAASSELQAMCRGAPEPVNHPTHPQGMELGSVDRAASPHGPTSHPSPGEAQVVEPSQEAGDGDSMGGSCHHNGLVADPAQARPVQPSVQELCHDDAFQRSATPHSGAHQEAVLPSVQAFGQHAEFPPVPTPSEGSKDTFG